MGTRVAVCLIIGAPLWAQEIKAPLGWNSSTVGDRQVLIPRDLPPSTTLEVQVFRERPLAGQTIENWVEDQLASGFAGLSLQNKNPLQRQNERMYTAALEYRDQNGQTIVALCNALVPDPERAQLVCMLTPPNRELSLRYTPAVGQMVATILQGPDLSPGAAKGRKEEARAERARYKYVTEPGKGVAASQIEAVIHHGAGEIQVTGYRFVEKAALLLKDGTVHFGVPCPPADLDVAASRKYEPEAWGTWRRNGRVIEARRKDGERWTELPGQAVTPAAPAEKMEGTFSTRSSYDFGGSGSTFYSAFTFRANGRFELYKRSQHASSSGSNTATGTSVHASGDNSGSVAGAVGPGIAVSSQTKRQDRGDRSGTYTFDGYTLEMRYDDGSALRLAAFYWDAKRKDLWIAGTTYSRDK